MEKSIRVYTLILKATAKDTRLRMKYVKIFLTKPMSKRNTGCSRRVMKRPRTNFSNSYIERQVDMSKNKLTQPAIPAIVVTKDRIINKNNLNRIYLLKCY